MEQVPENDAAARPDRNDPAGTDDQQETDDRQEKAPDPTSEDDGSVPEKQIQRWKEEGGSFRPAG